MRHTIAGVVLAAVLGPLTGGCGSGAGPMEAGGDSSTVPLAGSTTTSEGGGAVRTQLDGQPVVTEPRPDGTLAWRTFDVDGTAVETLTSLDALPQHATLVRFTGTLIDSGDGLELCFGGVALSLPPQCSGPVVDGLDPTGWSETQNGVTWGGRTVTVVWPPMANGHLTLAGDEPALQLPPSDDDDVAAMSQLPTECEGIERFAARDAVSAYSDAHPDQIGAVWSIRQGETLVLGVVEAHVDEVRAALSTDGARPCIVPMRYSMAQLQAVQQRLSDIGVTAAEVLVQWSGQMGTDNQVSVGVAVADRATVQEVARHLDDPGMIRVVGTAEILDGA